MTSGMGRKLDAHACTAALARIENVETRAMAACDFFDDGQAQAGALSFAAGRAVETFAHAFAFCGRDARSAVLNFQIGRTVVHTATYCDVAATRCVADGVVEQV